VLGRGFVGWPAAAGRGAPVRLQGGWLGSRRAACRRSWMAARRVLAASSRTSMSPSLRRPLVWSTHMSRTIPSSSAGWHAAAIRSRTSSTRDARVASSSKVSWSNSVVRVAATARVGLVDIAPPVAAGRPTDFRQNRSALKNELRQIKFSGRNRTATSLNLPGFAGTGAPSKGAFVFLGLLFPRHEPNHHFAERRCTSFRRAFSRQ
jgi:hypothetical protein